MLGSAATIPGIIARRADATPARRSCARRTAASGRRSPGQNSARNVAADRLALPATGFAPGDVAGVSCRRPGPRRSMPTSRFCRAGGAERRHPPRTRTPNGSAISCAPPTAHCCSSRTRNNSTRCSRVRDACPALRRIVVFDMKGLRDFSDPAVHEPGGVPRQRRPSPSDRSDGHRRPVSRGEHGGFVVPARPYQPDRSCCTCVGIDKRVVARACGQAMSGLRCFQCPIRRNECSACISL